MATYVILSNWTDLGIRGVEESPDRLEASRTVLESMGGTIQSFFMTMGGYDMVAVITAPNDAVAARYLVHLGKQGAVRTQTLRAFDEAEYRQLIQLQE